MCDDFSHEFSLLSKKHDLIAISVTDPYEAIFPNINLAALTDLETGQKQLIDTGAYQREHSYREAAERHLAALQKLTAKENSGFIGIRTDLPYLPPIEEFFKMRSLPFK
jgi:hypothetical protein